MDDRGEIVSAYDVDGNIALQIWTKGLSPRLVVFNKNHNTRKLIRLAWLEKADRRLFVKGQKRGASIEYALADLLPILQRVLSEYAVYASFKTRLWTFSVTLEKVLHAPVIISEKKELALLSEDKRSFLWIADVTGEKKGEGFFRPFFPFSDREKDVVPEEGPAIAENRRGIEDLLKTGVTRRLSGVRPERWLRPVRIMAAAMLLGFSFCGEDGSEFSDELWGRDNAGKPPAFKLNDPRLLGLGRKFVAFVRHFDLLGDIRTWTSLDSDRELQNDGYARKRRIELGEGLLGDTGYFVTFFEREDGMAALGCRPKAATQKHRGELIYAFPGSVRDRALSADAFGGTPDDYFTVSQLASAVAFAEWLECVAPYVVSFAGLP